MNTRRKIKLVAATITLALVCGTANAQHWRWHHRPYQVVAVVSQPAVTTHISNRFSQKERLAMAIAYLKTHEYLTIKEYAQMTKLTKATAEAELDTFAMSKNKPIKIVVRGKKKVYTVTAKSIIYDGAE